MHLRGRKRSESGEESRRGEETASKEPAGVQLAGTAEARQEELGKTYRKVICEQFSAPAETESHMCFFCVAQTGVLRVQLSKLVSLRADSMVTCWHHQQLGQSPFSQIAGVTHHISGHLLRETEAGATLKFLIASYVSEYF